MVRTSNTRDTGFPSGQTRSVCRRSCSNKEIERDDDPKKVIPLHEKREMGLYYSSFHRYVREGQLPEDWAGDVSEKEADFGEPAAGGSLP